MRKVATAFFPWVEREGPFLETAAVSGRVARDASDAGSASCF
jgi:hypothetical protein